MTPERAALIEAMAEWLWFRDKPRGALSWRDLPDTVRRTYQAEAQLFLAKLSAHFTARGWKVLGPEAREEMVTWSWSPEHIWRDMHSTAPSFPWDEEVKR